MKWTERIRKKTDFKKQIEKRRKNKKNERLKNIKNILKESETSSILWLSCHQQHLLLSRNQLVDTWKQNYKLLHTCQSTWSEFTCIQNKCKSKFFCFVKRFYSFGFSEVIGLKLPYNYPEKVNIFLLVFPNNIVF